MSVGLDSLTNSGGMANGDAKSGVSAAMSGDTVFSRSFGNIGGSSVQWWVWVLLFSVGVLYLWKKK